jgi:hypothetical protein
MTPFAAMPRPPRGPGDGDDDELPMGDPPDEDETDDPDDEDEGEEDDEPLHGHVGRCLTPVERSLFVRSCTRADSTASGVDRP